MKKKLKKTIVVLLDLSIICCMVFVFGTSTNAEQSWETAFYNDVDGDGKTELLPLIYSDLTSYTFTPLANNIQSILPRDTKKYGFVDKSDPDSAIMRERAFYNKYGFNVKYPNETKCNAYMNELKDTYGESSDEVKAFQAEVDEILAIIARDKAKDAEAEILLQADRDKYLAEHPDIQWGHIINSTKTVTEVKENTLLYWLHVPYDYDSSKSYPIMVYAHGEDQSLKISRYINEDGTYKVTKANMSTDINGFMNQWYNFVKNPGENRDKYDCFFIYICNTNEFFRGDVNKGIGIVSQHNDYDADTVTLDSTVTGDASYNASYKNTYDASRLSAGINEQLLCSLIDDLARTYSIDLTRQYIAGFSLGGIFTMDIISHYPNRFAAAVPICTASSDISEENCKNLVNTNIWAISGAGDSTCSKYFSKYFVEAINSAREKFRTGENCVAQYSFFSGGHSGGYFGPTLRTATSGVSITSATDIIDFVFSSKREDVNNTQMKYESMEIERSAVDLITSKSVTDAAFDALLVGTDFVGDYMEKGFVVEFEYNDGNVKTFAVKVSDSADTITTTLDGDSFKLSSDSYEALALFGKTIRNIPVDVGKIRLRTYAKGLTGEYYSHAAEYEILIEGSVVNVKK